MTTPRLVFGATNVNPADADEYSRLRHLCSAVKVEKSSRRRCQCTPKMHLEKSIATENNNARFFSYFFFYAPIVADQHKTVANSIRAGIWHGQCRGRRPLPPYTQPLEKFTNTNYYWSDYCEPWRIRSSKCQWNVNVCRKNGSCRRAW